MDLILYNGQIHTMNNQDDICQAVHIKNELITAIGTNSEILSLKSENTQVIDLKNRMAFPGFNDSHMHLLGYGMALCQVDLAEARSIPHMIEITKKFILENNLPADTWLMGRGWNQDLFQENRMPNRYDLNDISTKHLIVLRRVCGHVSVVNDKVLDTLGLSSSYTEISGGNYENGIFRENALDLVLDQIPQPTKDELKHYIKTGISALHAFGITSVQSDDLCVLPKEMSKTILETFEEMSLDNTLKLGVYEQSLFRDINNFQHFITLGYQANQLKGTFKYGPLKILGDGALGGRTAWLKDGYADSDTKGISMYSQGDLNDYVELSQKHKIPVAIHCIGDAMLDSALEAIISAQNKYPQTDLRHGIVHCQITRPKQLQTMKDHNILAYVQPIFLDYDLNILEARVGKALALSSYAWLTMSKLEIPIPFGSDAPVETPNPIKGIYCAVNRQTLQGWPKSSYNPKEKIEIYQAFKNYTRVPAYSSYEENIKGQLDKNYYADIAVLDSENLSDLLKLKIKYTIFRGEIVYEKQKNS